MRSGPMSALMAAGALALSAAPALGASKNVELLDNLPEAKNATAINFLSYTNAGQGNGAAKGREALDVMLVTGRFGLKSYSLADPAHPRLLDELTAEQLRLPGDPEVRYGADGTPISTFWQNEDMDVDRKRKLAIMSRDPRAYAGTTTLEPGEANAAGATNIAGFYVVDVRDPADMQMVSFQQLPTGHTTTCVNDCRWLWSGGPASTNKQRTELGWTFGRPIIATDLSNPRKPRAYPTRPLDLHRRDGATAYSHDVQVDAMGIAWVSGDGGTRGYWTRGRHLDPLQGVERQATALDPIPYAGGGLPASVVGDSTGGFEHNAWRPVGDRAPSGDPRYRAGELLLATEEDFGPAGEYCRNRGQFTIASLAGSYGGEAWRSTPRARSGCRSSASGVPICRRARVRKGSTPRWRTSARLTTSTSMGRRSRTPGTARAPGSWTSRIRPARRSSPTGAPTTASCGRRTCTEASCTPPTAAAESTCCA